MDNTTEALAKALEREFAPVLSRLGVQLYGTPESWLSAATSIITHLAGAHYAIKTTRPVYDWDREDPDDTDTRFDAW